MDLIDINKFRESQDPKIIKKVPILTDQLIATMLIIEPDTNIPAHDHLDIDEVHYIIRGSGRITIGNETGPVNDGIIILVPRGKSHCYSTSKDKLTVISVRLAANRKEKPGVK